MILKNTLKKIGKSFGRFASLVAIILIGVGFYAGIRQSIPAIRDVQNQFTADTNMMDLHIVSTLGLTDDDIEELSKLPDVTGVTGGYSKYVYSNEDVIRVMSIDLDIDVYQIKDGKYPIEKNECLADYRFYKVGDLIRITEPTKSSDSDEEDSDDEESDDEDDNKDDLKIHTFVVSGTVVSPIYIGTDYGSANIGDGELKSYILVKDSAFTYDAYTDIYMTMAKSEEDIPYSDSYNEKLESLKSSVEGIKKDRQKARETALYEEAKQKAYDKVEEKKSEIEAEVREEVEKEVRKAIEDKQEEQKAKLREQAGKLGTTFEKLVSTLSDKVQSALSPVTDEQVKKQVDEQMDDALATAMDEAREEAVKKIDIPECKWIIQTRNEVVSQYKILVEQYKEVESIADIIPIFFIIIVVLMTSNTMSRMIAEERLEMGTFTSLGYSNASIIGGYMIYVLVATVLGAAGGYFLGVYLLPPFVYACFPVSLPDISFTFRPVMFWSCMAVSFVVMTFVTIFSCLKELKEKPAYLLRPVPPKSGRTLLLERIGFIWNHITFSWKTTIRNIARYKGRGLMTIIGVGGCTFLMFVGFAIRDCISTVGDKQFDQVLHYDVLAVLSEDAKRHYSKWIPEEKLRVCYNGLDVSREPSKTMKALLAHDCRRAEQFKGDSILIGCICELVKIKNLDVMLQAMALLPLEYKLLLIGSGADEKSLQEQADRLGISDRVLFLGYRDEAHRLLPLVDIYAMTSRSEGFCLALTEAAMYGKKIVCADIPGMREKYTDTEVTYYNVCSEKELSEAILYAENDEEKAVKAQVKAEKEFTAAKMCERYLRVMKD